MDQSSKTVEVTSPPPAQSPTPTAPAPTVAAPPAPARPKAAKKPSVAELEAAHALAHKRLTRIEIIGVGLLIGFALAALAGWAYYQQTSQTHSEPYSTNVYQ